MFRFEILHNSRRSSARIGRIHTPHGIIETPNFVPVATNAALKAVDSILLNSINVQLLFCNTYHLLLHPGTEIINQAGGLHTFMNRTKPIITDSGGFQIFSLAFGTVHDELKSKGQKKNNQTLLKVTETGVTFRSYRDGKKVLLTPESSIQAQKNLGADIIIPLDELPPFHINDQALIESFDRTHRWQKRSLDEHIKNPQQQALYGVIHGGINNELRKKSCTLLSGLPFDGFAIGGSLGKTKQQMIAMLAAMMQYLPVEKPRHLLGIGDTYSLAECIALGLDTFDSSHPTRCARHGHIFTHQGIVKITQSKFKSDFSPLDNQCSCATCQHHTKAYLHHLFKAHELSAFTLASLHNVQHMIDVFEQYRNKILNDEL